MRRPLLALLCLIVIASACYGQKKAQIARRLHSGTADPNGTPCAVGPPYTDYYIKTNDHSEWQCTNAAGTWTMVVTGGTVPPADATYITQTANATLTNEQALASLATGILKSTTTTGIISISNVTDDVQTKAAIVPNTAPSSGQILAGNAGGTAYAPVSVSGDATLASTGALTLASTITAGGPTGSATVAPIITYDAKGRLTTVTSATITPAVGSITGLGTGVATALGVNVGSAGAPVLFNGAGGTPSSLTGTNITGTAAGLTAGTASAVAVGGITGLGTGVATALAVNVGTAGAFVVNGGALGSPSSAGTLPAHTLGGTVSGGGNQINNVIIGTTTPLAGFFTTVQAGSGTATDKIEAIDGPIATYHQNASTGAGYAIDFFTNTTGSTKNSIGNVGVVQTATNTRAGDFVVNLSNAGAPAEQFRIVKTGGVQIGGLVTKYNAITTAGEGVPAIYGAGRVTAQTAANSSIATYTVGASDSSFIVSANVNVTTSTTHTFSIEVAYTDETNTARIVTFNVQQLGGTLVTSITNVTGAGPYEGVPLHIRAKASTAITIRTNSGGTYTTVTYNAEGVITQIQ